MERIRAAPGDGRRGWEGVWGMGAPLFHPSHRHTDQRQCSAFYLTFCLTETNTHPTCIFWSALPAGWRVLWWLGRVQGTGLASCPLRGGRGEVRVLVAVAGEGFSCPAQGCTCSGVADQDAGPCPWGAAWGWAGNSWGLGPLEGPSPGASRSSFWPSSQEDGVSLEGHGGNPRLTLAPPPAWHCTLSTCSLH